jgi:uncharacterized membrane protein YdjX (TVP38/TMEM64 family)
VPPSIPASPRPAPVWLGFAKLLGLLVLVIGAAIALRAAGLAESLSPAAITRSADSLRALPWIVPAFIATYTVFAAVGLPATPLTLAGGALFGTIGGTAANWVGATLGATGAFLLARALGADAVRRLLGRRAAVLDQFVARAGFLPLLRLRLIPVVPFNGLNFGAGLSGVPLRTYVASTALGILPGTAIYTYFADALLSGVEGAQAAAFGQLAIAATLLILLSFVPLLAKRVGWLVVAALLAAPAAPVSAQATVDHSPWTAMLSAYVQNGIVDYDAFAEDPRFPVYLRSLASVSAASLPRDERLAYWINVYNAYTIELINSRGERGSIRNINKRFGITTKSPWAEPIVRADRRTLTLDDVEHKIIRPEFNDPRIHAALVCAALGCPPLRAEAFTGAALSVQLDDQVRRFLSDPSKNRVDVARRRAYASPIFNWYREDFGGSVAGVGAFWANYLPAGPAKSLLLSGDFTITDTDYDWTLNSPTHARGTGGSR